MKASELIQLLQKSPDSEVAVHAGDLLYFPLQEKDITLNNEANAWLIELDLKTKRPVGIVAPVDSLMP